MDRGREAGGRLEVERKQGVGSELFCPFGTFLCIKNVLSILLFLLCGMFHFWKIFLPLKLGANMLKLFTQNVHVIKF